MAEKTDAQKRAQKAYMEKFVRVEIRMDAEQRAAVQAHAEAHSESVNGFINRAISETMERDGLQEAVESPTKPAEAGEISLPSEGGEAVSVASEGQAEANKGKTVKDGT